MNKSTKLQFDELYVGKESSFEVQITPDLVSKFASFSGDYNPLHTDKLYADNTEFGNCIPHGMIVGALFSRLIGMELPGCYSVYLGQTLTFHQPIPLLGNIVIRGVITKTSPVTRTITLETTASSIDGQQLVHGKALVKLLK